MAGDWIPMFHELPDSPEVARIIDLTDTTTDCVCGRLFLMWTWFDAQTLDGRMSISLSAVARKCGGDLAFWEAVCAAGWLIVEGNEVIIPKFTERFGDSARSRLKEAKRKKDYEKRRKRQDDEREPEKTPKNPTNPGDKRVQPASIPRAVRGKRAENARQQQQSESKQESEQLPESSLGSEIINPPVTTTTSQSAPQTAGTLDGESGEETQPVTWAVVAVKLKKFGINRATEAIQFAKENGYSVETANDCLDWLMEPARIGRWEPGVIYDRFRNPDLCNSPCTHGWPTPKAIVGSSPPHPAESGNSPARAELDRKESAKRAEELAILKSAADRNESEFGDELDAMDEEQIQDLVADDAIARKQWATWGATSENSRPLLLKLLRKRSTEPSSQKELQTC